MLDGDSPAPSPAKPIILTHTLGVHTVGIGRLMEGAREKL